MSDFSIYCKPKVVRPADNSSNSANSTQSPTPDAALPLIDPKIKELCSKLGIQPKDLTVIKLQNPDFETLDFNKQQRIVAEYQLSQRVVSLPSSEENIGEQATQSNSFDRKAYNNLKSSSEKSDATLFEFTKNLYIYGSNVLKDKQGNLLAPAHSKDEWNNLSKEAKMAEVNKIRQYIETHDELGLKGKFSTIPDDKKGLLIDGTMTMIQAASAYEGGTSALDLMLTKTESERLDIKNAYLSQLNPDELSSADRQTLQYREFLGNAIIDVVNQRNRTAGREEFMGTIDSTDDISEYLRLYNIDENELVYNALKNKTDRTPDEDKIFNRLNETYGQAAGQDLIKQDKIANLRDLRREFRTLQAKAKNEELVGEELQRYNVIQETLNTDESKELMHFIKHLPQPETDFEKSVVADSKILRKQNRDFQGAANLNAIKFLEDKMKGMSSEERKNYIEAFLKFGHSGEKATIYAHYRKEFPELHSDPNNVSVAALCTAHYTEQEAEAVNKARIEASNSNNPLLHDSAIAAQQTANAIYQSEACSGPEFDNQKIINTNCAVNMHYNNDEEAIHCLNGATDVNVTITDAKIQREAQDAINNRPDTPEEVHVHTVSRTPDFHKDNQIYILDGATSHSAKATAFAAENNIVSQLDPSNQKDAYSLLQSRINEQYKGADAEKYQTALEGQIKDCEPSVQNKLRNNVNEYNNEKFIKQEVEKFSREYDKLDLSKVEDIQKFLEIVDKNPIAISNFLASADNQTRDSFIEAYCKHANPTQILTFIKNNPSLYMSVISKTNGVDKKAVFKILIDSHVGNMNNIAKDLGINLIDFAKEYKVLAPKIALLTKNRELARDILTNPEKYEFNLASSVTDKLRQLASQVNIPEKESTTDKRVDIKA